MRQGAIPSTDPALKDSRSEPDCTKPLLAPPIHLPTEASVVSEMPSSKRHTLSRSQVGAGYGAFRIAQSGTVLRVNGGNALSIRCRWTGMDRFFRINSGFMRLEMFISHVQEE